MKTKTIAIGLAADRIDMLVCHGDRVLGGRRIGLTPETELARWCQGVKGASKALRAAAAELGASGAPAIVLYRSPSECAEYANLRFKSTTEAQQAAILGCAELLSCPLDLAVCEAVVLGRDAAGEQPQTHVVVAADRDESVSAIAAMVEEAGLKFVSATPTDAAIMCKVARAALRNNDQYTCSLYIGEQRSFFVISGERSLLFARAIGLGIEPLATSLTRPIRTATGPEPIQLSLDTARRMLHEYGFPDRRQIVHHSLGLVGGQIIPLLQPTVQRFIIELRQSLRFGLPEDQRQSVTMTICGPGSAIPGFAKVIADELKVSATAQEQYAKYNPNEAGSAGSELLDAVLETRAHAGLGLMPQHTARVRHLGRMRRWLWSGAAAAIALIGLDAYRYHQRLEGAKLQAQIVAEGAADQKIYQETAQKLLEGINAMNKLEGVIAAETGAHLDFLAYLKELSRLTPESVRLSNVSFDYDGTNVIGSVHGYAFEYEGGRGKTHLESFISALRASPLFDRVVLAHVQAGTLAQQQGQRFEASFTAITTPRQSPHVPNGAPPLVSASSSAAASATSTTGGTQP